MTWKDICAFGLFFLFVYVLDLYCYMETYRKQFHSLPTVEHRKGMSFFEDMTFSYSEALRRVSFSDRSITLIYVDNAYLDMALNLYEFSILRLRLNNTLFIAPSRTTCWQLISFGAHCYAYTNITQAGSLHAQAFVYGSRGFWEKVGARVRFLYEALVLNYTVFHIDADVLLFKNPWLEFSCSSCDLEMMSEALPNNSGNVGTVLIRPTIPSLRLLKILFEILKRDPLTKLQRVFNALLAADRRVKYRYLNPKTFLCGKEYFGSERVIYPFGKQCLGCVLVHNNFIYTKEAKVYRFRENLLWIYDEDGYYSSLKVRHCKVQYHYRDVIMSAMASKITSLTIVCSTVYSGVDQRKHQSSASLAFVWGIHRSPVTSPHKWTVTRKMFPFDDVIMIYTAILTHLPLVPHICLSALGQHWFK